MYRDGEKHIFNETFLYILLFHFPVNLGSRITSKGVFKRCFLMRWYGRVNVKLYAKVGRYLRG